MATSTFALMYHDISFMDALDKKAYPASDVLMSDDTHEVISPLNLTSPEQATVPQTPTESAMGCHVSTIMLPKPSPTHSAFLDLPLEIRLQIYSHLLPTHPAKHAHLSPSKAYPPATSSAYFMRALSSTLALSFPNFEPAGKSEPHPFPSATPEPRGCGYIPAALLATCRQVYEEARPIPWQENEYVFINWFCSGVYAARAFLRALKPWQRTTMRWARVEVLGRDLKDSWVATMVGGRAGGGEWKDLCSLWAGEEGAAAGGLRGLRLGIKGRIGDNVTGISVDGSGGDCDPLSPRERGILDVDAEWVVSGLCNMKDLRWVELDIEDELIERDEKVRFCIELGEKLTRVGNGWKVDVLFVEKVEDKKAAVRQEELAWGEPGDDYIWGLDS
jgi:hypothetical protein